MAITTKLAVAMSLLAACATDDPANPDDMDDDGPTDPLPEPDPDTGTVTPEPEPEPGHINVLVTSNYTGLVQPGRRVIFSAPDGTVVLDTMTDDKGLATAEMEAGYVTIVRDGLSGPSGKIVHTVLDVHAGDTVRFGPDPNDAKVAGYATITHDAIPVADHRITSWTPCNTGAGFDFGKTTLTMELESERCSSKIPIISSAGTWDQNNFGDVPQLFSVGTERTLQANGTLAMPAWTPAQTTQLSLTGVPSGVRIAYGFSATLLAGGVRIFDQYKNFAPIFDGVGATTWKRPQGFGDNFLFEASWKNDNVTYLGEQTFSVEAGLQDSVALPYTSTRARWLMRPYVQLSQTGPQKLAWASEGTATDGADIAWIQVGHGNTIRGVAWTILGPAPTTAAGTIVLPKLPADLDLLPTESISKARIALLAADGASYADLREHVAFYMDNAIELDWYDWSGNSSIVREMVKLPKITGARMTLSPRP